MYQSVFVPKTFYAVRFWAPTLTKVKDVEALNRIQRRALLGITVAYNTTSTMALQVIAGILPLDLEAQYQARKADTVLDPAGRHALKLYRDELVNSWQNRWQSSTRGRWTYRFFPSVVTRLATPIWLNHRVVQFLSGHGNFRAKLHSFNLTDSDMCECSREPETVEHILFVCHRFELDRARLEMVTFRAGHHWPCEPSIFVSAKVLFEAFDCFTNSVLKR